MEIKVKKVQPVLLEFKVTKEFQVRLVKKVTKELPDLWVKKVQPVPRVHKVKKERWESLDQVEKKAHVVHRVLQVTKA